MSVSVHTHCQKQTYSAKKRCRFPVLSKSCSDTYFWLLRAFWLLAIEVELVDLTIKLVQIGVRMLWLRWLSATIRSHCPVPRAVGEELLVHVEFGEQNLGRCP